MSEKTKAPTKKLYYDQRSVALRTKQVVHFVQEHDKALMLDLILKNYTDTQCVIVVKSKHKADELATFLASKDVKALAAHGNHRKEQLHDAREKFNTALISLLITTDKTLELLELKDIKLLVSHDLPLIPQEYYNRLAYMNELGAAITLVSPEDDKALSDIEYNMKSEIEEKEVEGFVPTPIPQGNRLGRKIKDKKKKPRHRKMKTKKNDKAKED